MNPIRRTTLVLIVLLASAILSLSHAEGAEISRLKVEHKPMLKLSFSVKDAFTKDVEEAIKSGIPTSFTFVIKLYRKRTLWPDELIGSWRFTHTVRYDMLKEVYEVVLTEKGITEKVKDREKMRLLMATVRDMAVSPTPVLKEGEVYELRLKAKLYSVKLPFLLKYVLFFLKYWDVETGWHVYSFSL